MVWTTGRGPSPESQAHHEDGSETLWRRPRQPFRPHDVPEGEVLPVGALWAVSRTETDEEVVVVVARGTG